MTIYFVDLKYGNILNASFTLEDGRFNIDISLERYAKGDEVDLMWEISERQAEIIDGNCVDKEVRVRAEKMSEHDSLYAWIRFVVERKRHVLAPSRKSSSTCEPVTTSLCLRPVSWGHEDIFRWLIMGQRPSWIDDEEWEEVRP